MVAHRSEKNYIKWADLLSKIKKQLDQEIEKRNQVNEISKDKPDPILVAKRYNDENIALICALFAYGNAKLIVKFLESLDFSLLDKEENEIKKALQKHYYRFQNSDDIIAFFISLKRLKKIDSIENIFKKEYVKNSNVLEGISAVIKALQSVNTYSSKGYKFLISKPYMGAKEKSPYKRWNMYLRWMVRKDNIDMGLWSGVNTADLLIPLDTHTFKVSLALGLLKRKTYDYKAVLELTQQLKQFDDKDPIKYDFALYRMGQEKMIL